MQQLGLSAGQAAPRAQHTPGLTGSAAPSLLACPRLPRTTGVALRALPFASLLSLSLALQARSSPG